MNNYPMGVNGSSDYFNQPDPPECPHCYTELEADWRFCPWCGERIDWSEVYGDDIE